MERRIHRMGPQNHQDIKNGPKSSLQCLRLVSPYRRSLEAVLPTKAFAQSVKTNFSKACLILFSLLHVIYEHLWFEVFAFADWDGLVLISNEYFMSVSPLEIYSGSGRPRSSLPSTPTFLSSRHCVYRLKSQQQPPPPKKKFLLVTLCEKG